MKKPASKYDEAKARVDEMITWITKQGDLEAANRMSCRFADAVEAVAGETKVTQATVIMATVFIVTNVVDQWKEAGNEPADLMSVIATQVMRMILKAEQDDAAGTKH